MTQKSSQSPWRLTCVRMSRTVKMAKVVEDLNAITAAETSLLLKRWEVTRTPTRESANTPNVPIFSLPWSIVASQMHTCTAWSITGSAPPPRRPSPTRHGVAKPFLVTAGFMEVMDPSRSHQLTETLWPYGESRPPYKLLPLSVATVHHTIHCHYSPVMT